MTGWRMTLDEFCYVTRASQKELTEWAQAGLFGPAWQVSTEGKWRHITKEVARSGILMRAYLDAGLAKERAVEATLSTAHLLEAKPTRIAYRGDGFAVVLKLESIQFP